MSSLHLKFDWPNLISLLPYLVLVRSRDSHKQRTNSKLHKLMINHFFWKWNFLEINFWTRNKKIRYCAIFMKYCAIMRYCAIINSCEICDWSNSCVTQIWACDTKCDTIKDFFHGQTLIKFIFKSKLWHNVSFVPQFSRNLPKFLEISKFGSLLDPVIKYTQYFPN